VLFSGLFAEHAGSGASFMESPEGGMRSREHDNMPFRRKHAPQLRQPSGRLRQVFGQGGRGHRIEGLAGGRRSEETVEREEPHGLFDRGGVPVHACIPERDRAGQKTCAGAEVQHTAAQ